MQFRQCRQDLVVEAERVVEVLENTCPESWLLSVEEIFDFFAYFVGTGASRQRASNACDYYAVRALYHDELGYPLYMETQLISGISERKQYLAWITTFSCLALLSPVYQVEIESLTPLP